MFIYASSKITNAVMSKMVLALYFIVRNVKMEAEERRFAGIDLGKREYAMAIIEYLSLMLNKKN